jgi:acyl carrier protein
VLFSRTKWEPRLSVLETVKAVLDQTLQLGDRAKLLDAQTGLFGTIPEFDSMAVITVVTAIEEQFGIVLDDDEISAEVFETVGSLSSFIEKKISM